jgi:cation transport ATPase
MDPARSEGSLAPEGGGAPSSIPASTCPGCGKRVDPLRAGHVAALEGRGFHYFCRASCKDEYLRAQGRPAEDDVETARPPDVEYANGSTATPTPAPALAAGRPSPAEPQTERSPVWAGPEQPRDTTPDVRIEGPRSGIRRGDRALSIVDGLGIVAGVLAPTIGLLGTVAEVARAPLVALAWVALFVRVQRAPRDQADPHFLVVLGPTAGAAVAALWARLIGDPRAVAIAALAGLSCAVAIAVEALVARARVRVQLARERVERALDVGARAVHGDDTVELHSSEVRPGEQVVIEANEVVGVDATITAGEARVVPWLDARIEVIKREGDPIVAGALVLSSRLRVTTTWSGRERAWVKLLSVVSARIDVTSPTARALRHTVERGVPIAAALVGLATFAANGTPVEILAAMSAGATAFGSKALASLVAVHFARAHLEALSSGITYKDPRAFERAGSANIAVLSARGTVLMGEPEIVAIEPIGAAGRTSDRRDAGTGDDDVVRVLSLAAGAETASTHPFAAAILRAARARSVQADHVRNATIHSGLGVTALASSGERLVVGGRSIMLSEKIGVASADARVTELEAQGRSVLLVALGDRLVGLIALQDGLRVGARAAVQRLLDARIEPVLLSGEARDTCETIGRALDIEHVRPAVLPADRGAEVRALGEGGSVVACVGHPLSDDGALGAADVAIAMGAAGSTPGEWAIALASDDVRDAALALSIPHATRVRVRVAITLGAVPGIVALLAVGFGVAPLSVAPLASLLGAVAVALHARDSQGAAPPRP